MKEQYIFKNVGELHHTRIPNKLINDRSLSLDSKMILVYLLSKPLDWRCYKTDLMKYAGKGDYTIRRILKELAAKKYIFRIRVRQEGGKFRWDTLVFNEPQTDLEYNNVKWKEYFK